MKKIDVTKEPTEKEDYSIKAEDVDFKDPEQEKAFFKQFERNGQINLHRELHRQYKAGIIDENGNYKGKKESIPMEVNYPQGGYKMTVGELKEQLNKFPDNMQVKISVMGLFREHCGTLFEINEFYPTVQMDTNEQFLAICTTEADFKVKPIPED